MAQKVYGYKDRSSKAILLFTGLVVLVWLNIWVFIIFIKYPQWQWRFLGWLIVLGRVFRRMWRIQAKLYYVFSKESITIVLPGGKKFVLPKEQIIKTEKIQKWSARQGRGIKYLPRKQELHFTTSTEHLLKIFMKDGRVVVISPREYVKK